MKFGKRHPDRHLRIDMTPMIDIVFQLLIFFLVTAQAVRITRADVELPREQGEQKEEAEQAGLVINLLMDGRIIVSDQEYQVEDLEALLRDSMAQYNINDMTASKVTVRADRRAPSERLNSVVQRLHELGVGAAKVATSPSR